MSHEIDMSNGRANVMVTGEPAWHRLGVNVEEAPTSAKAMELAGLDWSIEKWPVYAHQPDADASDGDQRHCDGHVALVRSDTKATLSIMSPSYMPLQNGDAFKFMDSLVESGDVQYETAGSLKGGRVVWMLARIPTTINVGQNDLTNPYVLLSNSHDGSQAIRIHPTAIRVVCNNTLRLSQRSAGFDNGLSIMHVGNVNRKVDEARRVLGLVTEEFERYGQFANRLVQREMTRGEFDIFARDMFPVSQGASDRSRKSAEGKSNRLRELFYDEPANNLPGMERTAWAALNAVTHYTDHEMRVTGQSEDANAENRLRSQWSGRGHKMKSEAVDRLAALVN